MGISIDDEKYYMITEHLHKGSLFDVLHKKKQKLEENLILNVVEDIVLGMTYLHGR